MNLFFKSWENPTSLQRLEVVFEGRNHEYGAYTIRRDYEKNAAFALLITCTAGVLLALTPILYNYFKTTETIHSQVHEIVLDLDQYVEPKDVVKPPVVDPPKPPPSSGRTEAFIVPTVTDKENTDSVPTQMDLSKTTISTVTSKGDSIEKELNIETTLNGGNYDPNKVFISVEEMPEFPGGESAMINFLSKNIHYPDDARKRNISGVVYISFIVTPSGSLDKITLRHGIGGGCEQEAFRVINAMPQWKPGKQNGRAVSVQYNLPLSFTLKD